MRRTLLRLTAGPTVALAVVLTAVRVLGARLVAPGNAAAFVALTLGALALATALFGVVVRRAGERWVIASAVTNAAATALYLGAWAADRAGGWTATRPPALLASLLLVALCAPGGVMFANGVRVGMLRLGLLPSLPAPPAAAAQPSSRRVT